MPRPKASVESALLKKGFQSDETHHHQFIFFTKAGKKTIVRTKTSHSKRMKVIPDSLLSVMARHQRGVSGACGLSDGLGCA